MPQNLETIVGQRIKGLRAEQGLSLRDLAEISGLSANTISLIENEKNSPTLSTLQCLAQALDVPITDFFQDQGGVTTVFVKKGEGMYTKNANVQMESLGLGLQNQELVPFLITLETGDENTVNEVSHGGQEFVHCLQGEIVYTTRDGQFHLESGDSLLLDAAFPHKCINQSQATAKYLLIFSEHGDDKQIHKIHLNQLSGD